MGLGPQRVQTPRTGLEDVLASLFSGATQPGGAGNLQEIFKQLSTPTYGGSYGVPQDPLQTLAGASIPGSVDFGTNVAKAAAGGLAGIGGGTNYAPTAITDLLSNLPGSDILKQLSQPNTLPGMADMFGLARSTPDFSSLSSILGTGTDTSALSSFLNVQSPAQQELMKAGSGGSDFGGIASALDQARQASLSRDLRDIQERFSTSGMGTSTNLAAELGRTAEESRSSFLGQLATLLPTLTGQKLSALTSAGQLGLGGAQLGLGAAQGLTSAGLDTRGQNIGGATSLSQLISGTRGQTGSILEQLAQLGLGQQGQQQQAATTLGTQGLSISDILGQLFQGQQGRQLSALQSLPGTAGIPLGLDTQAYGVGAQGQGYQDVVAQRAFQDFIRSQGALFPAILNYAAGAPQITGPGKGSQILGAGSTVAAAAAGA